VLVSLGHEETEEDEGKVELEIIALDWPWIELDKITPELNCVELEKEMPDDRGSPVELEKSSAEEELPSAVQEAITTSGSVRVSLEQENSETMATRSASDER
jgi:hypothetical protein